MKVKKLFLNYQNQKTNALIFLPEVDGEKEVTVKSTFAVFTHGYTADKSSILNWPARLSEMGASCILFDLPGHYLGNYSEVLDFEYFTRHAHELFYTAFLALKEAFLEEFSLHEHLLESDHLKLVLGGHSLGALLSLKALMLPEFREFERLSMAVGLGSAPKNITHVFDTSFYKSTLNIREQLVSPELKPDNVFPWIKHEKENLDIHNASVHLISGADDVVVGENGVERFAEELTINNNRVTIEKPSKLPHHEPQLAAAYVKKHLKKINWL